MPLVGLSPALAPLLGSWILAHFDWQAIFATLFAITLILMLPGFHYQADPPTLSSLLSGLAIFAYSYFMLFYLADWMDNGIRFHIRTLPLMIWSVIVNTVIAALSQLAGLWKHRQQQHWVKTEHSIQRNSAQRAPMAEDERKAESI